MNGTDEIVTESKPRLGFSSAFSRASSPLCGFCVMVIELVAGRVIAKHVGQSLYTWTSVIGIVLGGITLGNLIGGRLADRFDPRKVVALLFLFAALTCFEFRSSTLPRGIARRAGPERCGRTGRCASLHVTSVFFCPRRRSASSGRSSRRWRSTRAVRRAAPSETSTPGARSGAFSGRS